MLAVRTQASQAKDSEESLFVLTIRMNGITDASLGRGECLLVAGQHASICCGRDHPIPHLEARRRARMPMGPAVIKWTMENIEGGCRRRRRSRPRWRATAWGRREDHLGPLGHWAAVAADRDHLGMDAPMRRSDGLWLLVSLYLYLGDLTDVTRGRPSLPELRLTK